MCIYTSIHVPTVCATTIQSTISLISVYTFNGMDVRLDDCLYETNNDSDWLE